MNAYNNKPQGDRSKSTIHTVNQLNFVREIVRLHYNVKTQGDCTQMPSAKADIDL